MRQIPTLIPLPFKSQSFKPEDVKEMKGTILVAPAFMFILGDVVKSYLPLFDVK